MIKLDREDIYAKMKEILMYRLVCFIQGIQKQLK